MRLKGTYTKLFLSTFQLSACTFGGGFVIIPLMRKKFVEELGWIEEQEMMDLTAIAQSAPGAIAVNASILVGYHVAGIPGALLTVLGTVLPPLLIISVISFFYQQFRDTGIVNMAMAGMLAGVAAVICDVVINMGKSVVQQKKVLPILVLAGSFAAVRFFHVNIMIVILACGILGGLETWKREKLHKEAFGK
ncbi:MAG: chromate transporter [Ruminococcaceae bacterium]|nr:chromate transporter [Oscillospiraceae bacterium]